MGKSSGGIRSIRKYQGKNNGSGIASEILNITKLYSKISQLSEKDLENAEAIKIIKSAQENPEKIITIYRATPGKSINNGDWVFITEKQADRFTKSPLGNPKEGFKVLKLRVKAKNIGWTGKSLEFVLNYKK